MACVGDGSEVPVSAMPGTSSSYGSPNGSALISTEWVPAHLMHSSKSSDMCCYHLHRVLPITKATFRPSPILLSFSHPGSPALNRSSIPFLPRWPHSQKWNKTSAPSRHAYARLEQAQLLPPVVPARQALGIHLDIVMAPRPLGGPMCRPTTEQHHVGVSMWVNSIRQESNIPAYNKPITVHCKTGGPSASLVFETRAECQDFVARYKDDGIPYEIDSPLCNGRTNITVRQSKSLEDDLRLFGQFFSTKVTRTLPRRR